MVVCTETVVRVHVNSIKVNMLFWQCVRTVCVVDADEGVVVDRGTTGAYMPQRWVSKGVCRGVRAQDV